MKVKLLTSLDCEIAVLEGERQEVIWKIVSEWLPVIGVGDKIIVVSE